MKTFNRFINESTSNDIENQKANIKKMLEPVIISDKPDSHTEFKNNTFLRFTNHLPNEDVLIKNYAKFNLHKLNKKRELEANGEDVDKIKKLSKEGFKELTPPKKYLFMVITNIPGETDSDVNKNASVEIKKSLQDKGYTQIANFIEFIFVPYSKFISTDYVATCQLEIINTLGLKIN